MRLWSRPGINCLSSTSSFLESLRSRVTLINMLMDQKDYQQSFIGMKNSEIPSSLVALMGKEESTRLPAFLGLDQARWWQQPGPS